MIPKCTSEKIVILKGGKIGKFRHSCVGNSRMEGVKKLGMFCT